MLEGEIYKHRIKEREHFYIIILDVHFCEKSGIDIDF